MSSNFLPIVNKAEVLEAYNTGDLDKVYDLLVNPLHEELYKKQTFEFIDELSGGQKLLICYDYLRTHVLGGGFIQLIQNGYIYLLPTIIEQLQKIYATIPLVQTLDDVLKVYVLNREALTKETTVEEFARLYTEFKEFEQLDDQFNATYVETERMMLVYAISHLEEFIAH